MHEVAGKDWFDVPPEQRRARAVNDFKLEILPQLADFVMAMMLVVSADFVAKAKLHSERVAEVRKKLKPLLPRGAIIAGIGRECSS
jgi:hypothetical protein